jgi:hypothetical protein
MTSCGESPFCPIANATERSWFEIEARLGSLDSNVWTNSNIYPDTFRNGPVSMDNDKVVWEAFVAYLNVSRNGEYRLVRKTQFTTTEVVK